MHGDKENEEKGKSLKRKRAGHLSHCVTLVNEIEGLLCKYENKDMVNERMNNLNVAFDALSNAHKDYVKSLENEEDKAEAQVIMDNKLKGKLQLEVLVNQWMLDYSQAQLETLSNKSTENKKALEELGAVANAPQETNSIQRQVELDLKNLQREHHFARQEEELHFRRSDAARQREMDELKLKLDRIKIHDIIADDGNAEQGGLYNHPIPTKSHFTNKEIHRTSSPLQFNQLNSGQNEERDQTSTSQLHDAMRSFTDAVASLKHLDLPRPELPVFDGKPDEYYKFIHSFVTHIESNVIQNSARLSYLIQYCKGPAKYAIEDCVMLDEVIGYHQAKQILQNRFGRPHIVAQAFVQKLTSGPDLRANDSEALINLAADMRKANLTLSKLNFSADIHNSDTLLRIMARLPFHLQSAWASKANEIIETHREPKFEDLCSFIEKSSQVANTLYGQNLGLNRDKQRRSNTNGANRHSTFATNQVEPYHPINCVACGLNHSLTECSQFNNMQVLDRLQLLRQNGVCDNCLTKGHIAKGCLYPQNCSYQNCFRKHHSLLHMSNQNVLRSPNSNPAVNCYASKLSQKVSLNLLPVRVFNGSNMVVTYALLDSGSDVSLCSNNLLKKLEKQGEQHNYFINTISGSNIYQSGVKVSLDVTSLDSQSCVTLDSVIGVDKLPITEASIPKQCEIAQWPHLADLNFPCLDNVDVELLIGGNNPDAFWVYEQRTRDRKDPYAIKTLLGWALMGPITKHHKPTRVYNNNLIINGPDPLLRQLKAFWELDYSDLTKRTSQTGMSVNDKRALEVVRDGFSLSKGHYQVPMPWKGDANMLKGNIGMAKSRLMSLKRKLHGDNALLSQYTATVNKYISDGHARMLSNIQPGQVYNYWFLPHHGVTHPAKPNKLRVVFDCAAEYRGLSLNKLLHSGPDYTNSLIGTILRFRKFPVALTGDVEAMFHQVKTYQRDSEKLCFLWWPDGNLSNNPEIFQMLVHLFGATSSPFCANFSLRQTAIDQEKLFKSDVLSTVQRSFYVDDLLVSFPVVEQALEIYKDLRGLLTMGGFNLTKFATNSKILLDAICKKDRATTVREVDLGSSNDVSERVLGLKWNLINDTFEFSFASPNKPFTRRGLLSVTSSLYDPVGFLAPFCLYPKLLLQDLCRKNNRWDDEIEDRERLKWQVWLNNLPHLSEFSINRCIIPQDFLNYTDLQLHIFCDASELAYGAVAYLRIAVRNKVHCSFLLGKSRVAPIKVTTIPRLELLAAVLAVQLNNFIYQEVDIQIQSKFFWTDSMVVLQYIRNTTKRFQTFVSNRISEIHAGSNVSDWRFIPGKTNPADDASRGLTVSQICQNSRWLSGPGFLWLDKEQWPITAASSEILDSDPNIKNVNVITSFGTKAIDGLVERYSSYERLLVGIAWILRFKLWLINKGYKSDTSDFTRFPYITASEIKVANNAIIKYIQEQVFHEFSNPTKAAKSLPRKLAKLHPILVNGLLRVGGRLGNAPISDHAKHPIIIPKGHFSDLLIQHHHRINGHVGPGHTWAVIRQHYWIVSGSVEIKRNLSSCMKCRKRTAKCCEQVMADLPKARVTPGNPPFHCVGVDYFGPLVVKVGRSNQKRYGCIFTCMSTRAVDLEVAFALTTSSFLNVFRRFCCKHGTPFEVYSDNGTNFVGAQRELRRTIAEWNQQTINAHMRIRNILWNFNPPHAPHMGGVWERLIRSVKSIFYSMTECQSLTDEMLLTLFSEVENIMNSRPLLPISLDPRDKEPLCPNHLLHFRNENVPVGVFRKDDLYSRSRWRQIQYLADQFWRRWTHEYLPLLQTRSKWTTTKRNLQVNDVVMVVDANYSRGKWPLGIVVATFPNQQGIVRQVELKVKDSIQKWPITKLCLIEEYQSGENYQF